MKLLTDTQRQQLLANGRNQEQDHAPVVKFFNPCGLGTWLFTELDSNGDTLFGLCQIDYPELGYDIPSVDASGNDSAENRPSSATEPPQSAGPYQPWTPSTVAIAGAHPQRQLRISAPCTRKV